jgi:hypothetical protein
MNTVEFVDGGAPGISAALLNEPFQIKTPSNDNGNIVVTIGTGRANFGSLPLVEKLTDSQLIITSPTINTTYYIFLKSDGTFVSNVSSDPQDGQVLLGAVVVGETLNTLSKLDLRGMLPGCYGTVPSLIVKNRTGNTPFVDFFTSGNSNYDARISCSGGNTTAGNGDINFAGKYIRINDEELNKWATLGDTVLYTANAERSAPYGSSFSKRFRVKYPGNYRIHAELRTNTIGWGATVTATARGVSSSAFSGLTTYTGANIDLIGVGANELISVTVTVGGDYYHQGATGYMKNVSLRCNYINYDPNNYTYGMVVD